METIAITLDGVPVSGRQGMTILELAREVGVRIPTLCHDPSLRPAGACRLCLVEEEASRRLLASCVTPIASGMRILTRSPAVLEARRVILQLMLANHPESCVVCDKGNRCQLRQLAAEAGIGLVDYDRMDSVARIQEANPFLKRDLSKCVLCGKCIRADQELVVVGAMDYFQRGFQARPGTFLDRPLEHSECTFCGTCEAICPTGALSESKPLHLGTAPQRAATVCSYCGCGCSIWAHIWQDRLVRIEPKAEDSVNKAALCVRGRYGSDYLHSRDRLLNPMLRKNGELVAVSWQEAMDETAARLQEIAARHGPASVGFFGSTQCTNEENYLFQKLARLGIGTPNVDNGARFQAISGILAMQEELSISGATHPLEELEYAGVILVIGAQPLESHPVASYAIKRAVKQKGAQLIYVSPLEDALSRMAEIWIKPWPGSEGLILWALLRAVIALRGSQLPGWLGDQDPKDLLKSTLVDSSQVDEAARTLCLSSSCALVFGKGLSCSQAGTEGVRMLVRLARELNCLGVAGGGIYPLDRAANTQGACDMGTLPEFLPGYRSSADPRCRAELAQAWGKEPPAGPGMSLPEMLDAALRGELRALYIMGENPLELLPGRAAEALLKLELLVVQDIFPTAACQMAHVVLPAAGFLEKKGTYTSLERRVQRIRPVFPPPGGARPDCWILSGLLKRTADLPEYEAPAEVMKEISQTVPQMRGVRYARLEGSPIFWPCTDPTASGERILLRGGTTEPQTVPNPSKLAHIPPADPDFPFLAVEGESLFRMGSAVRSSRAGRLRDFSHQTLVFLNPSDMDRLGLGEQTQVKLLSRWGELKATALCRPDIHQGLLWVLPAAHGPGLAGLAPWSWDPSSKTPQTRRATVRLERCY